jgi:hypothetical protein
MGETRSVEGARLAERGKTGEVVLNHTCVVPSAREVGLHPRGACPEPVAVDRASRGVGRGAVRALRNGRATRAGTVDVVLHANDIVLMTTSVDLDAAGAHLRAGDIDLMSSRLLLVPMAVDPHGVHASIRTRVVVWIATDPILMAMDLILIATDAVPMSTRAIPRAVRVALHRPPVDLDGSRVDLHSDDPNPNGDGPDPCSKRHDLHDDHFDLCGDDLDLYRDDLDLYGDDLDWYDNDPDLSFA